MIERTARFAAELDCVGDARRFVRRVLAEFGLRDAEHVVSLLVTELATNAVLHGRTEFAVTVSADGASLRLGVSDDSKRLPATKSHS
ncbi:MAG TPA: ATP-binding protein, partial [Candidatus Dormibacteraeota bacterium]|nr:ATP-binding protein [Candidatus Dormibacteraeota bacterium]